MTKKCLTISLLCLSALSLAACQTPNLADFTTHLNERGCATKGSVTASAGITGASMGGNVDWDCGNKPAGLAPGQVVGMIPPAAPPRDPG